MANSKENTVGIVKTQMIRVVEENNPLELACGKTLGPIDVAYETYGRPDATGDNVVLICHALSGNAHVAGLNSPERPQTRLVGYYGRAGKGYRHQ